MNKLNSLEIKNVKGISHKIFKFDFFPNKPCILVAPNGYGKSSIACAFKALKSKKLELNDDDYHNENSSLLPELHVEVDNQKYEANLNQNQVSAKFDCFIINSPLVAKAKKTKVSGFTHASASLSVDTIELVSTIPDSVSFEYSITDKKCWFGANGKILTNIETLLLKNPDFIYLAYKNLDLTKYSKKKEYINPVNHILMLINSFNGTSQSIKNEIKATLVPNMEAVCALKLLAELIEDFTKQNTIDCYLHAIQFAKVTQTETFKKAVNYSLYCRDKQFFDNLLSSVNSTRHNLQAREVKKTKKTNKKKLVVDFPKVSSISNGQRDIISFISQIQKAKNSFRKNDCILIVDEIFDYLDDANLVSFQYYITKFIEEFKSQGRNLYPILLTHLDPHYFNHFCFSKHKMQVHYLDKNPKKVQSKCLDIVKNRKDPVVENDLSKYFFHYHPDNKDLELDFLRLNMKKEWGKSQSFYLHVYNEMNKYLLGNKYDPIAVLFSVRIRIEELAYIRLPISDQLGFLNTHKTRSKLEYCEDRGIQIHEVYYLLGLIYNDDLHWRSNRDYITPLVSKLENVTIKNMISELK